MLSGLPVVYAIKPFAQETVQSHQLGAIGFDDDGRKFRYAKAGELLVAGELLQARVEDTGDQSLAVAATAIGSFTVTTTDTVTVTANQYAEGYLVTTGEGGTGNGYAYKIKSHPAATAAVVTLTLYEPIQVALTTATQIDLVPNPYDGVITNPTAATSAPVGVAVAPIASGSYGWIQVGGAGLVTADASGAITVGAIVTASNQTAGACEDGDTDTQAIVGVALTGIAQAENGLVNLLLG